MIRSRCVINSCRRESPFWRSELLLAGLAQRQGGLHQEPKPLQRAWLARSIAVLTPPLIYYLLWDLLLATGKERISPQSTKSRCSSVTGAF